VTHLIRSFLVAASLVLAVALVLAPEAGAAATAVNIQNFSFQPATVTVPAGSTITWTNADSAPHTATAAEAYERLPPERHEEINPLRSLFDAGVKIALATDNVPVSMFLPISQTIARSATETPGAGKRRWAAISIRALLICGSGQRKGSRTASCSTSSRTVCGLPACRHSAPGNRPRPAIGRSGSLSISFAICRASPPTRSAMAGHSHDRHAEWRTSSAACRGVLRPISPVDTAIRDFGRLVRVCLQAVVRVRWG